AARCVGRIVLLMIRHIPLQNVVQDGPCVQHNELRVKWRFQGEVKAISR
ncbi:MAG: hypothetical protein ACJASK_002731, partial [Ilumatobacter sp.]